MVYALWYLGIGTIFCAGLLTIAFRDKTEDNSDWGLIVMIALMTVVVWPFALAAMLLQAEMKAERERAGN